MQRTFDDIFEEIGVVNKKNIAETSRQCYVELMSEGIANRYQEYLDALWDRGVPSTDSEVAFSVGKLDPNYFRPRRFELEQKGIVSRCSARRCSVSGRMALTFWFTEKGLNLVGD